jgi:hypothetical protein
LCDILKTYSTSLVPFLREFFDMARETIFEHGGVLDKYVGDGVMGLKIKPKNVKGMLFVLLRQLLN